MQVTNYLVFCFTIEVTQNKVTKASKKQ